MWDLTSRTRDWTQRWILNHWATSDVPFFKKIFIFIIGLHKVLVAACRIFSCSMWDLLPCLGIKPRPPALGVWSLSHWTTREVPESSALMMEVLTFRRWLNNWYRRDPCPWASRPLHWTTHGPLRINLATSYLGPYWWKSLSIPEGPFHVFLSILKSHLSWQKILSSRGRMTQFLLCIFHLTLTKPRSPSRQP